MRKRAHRERAPPRGASMIAESSRASAFVRPRSQSANVSDDERLRLFGDELDAVKQRVLARMGPADIAYVRKLNRVSHGMEVLGRLLIFVSPEPVTFTMGVAALW